MVNPGRPSRGCFNCRRRKLGCNEARPACRQCIRSRIPCGYGDLFRNQTTKVVRKARTQQPTTKDEEPRRISTEPSVPRALSPQSLESQGYCFFRHHYVAEDGKQKSFFFGNFALKNQRFAGLLAEAITPLGLATMANINRSDFQMKAARRNYSAALRAMNDAIRDTTKVSHDETFEAVMLLGLFELVVNDKLPSATLWCNHVAGVSALLNIRGTDQLETEFGRRLFQQARYQILVNCIAKGTPVPPILNALTEKVAHGDAEEARPLGMILDIMTRVCNSRVSMTSLSPSDVVARCEILDLEVASWPMCCPPVPTYVAMKSYSSYSMAWNVYRCLRIIINGLILEHLPEQSWSTKIEKVLLITQMCSNIYTSAKAQIESATELRVCDTLPLVWPLTVAAIAQQRTNDSSVIELLEYMGRVSGVRQCLCVAHTIVSMRNSSKFGNGNGERAFGALQTWREPSSSMALHDRNQISVL